MKPLKFFYFLLLCGIFSGSVQASSFELNGLVFDIKDRLPVANQLVYFHIQANPQLNETVTDTNGMFTAVVEMENFESDIVEFFTMDPCSGDTVYQYFYPYMSNNFISFYVCHPSEPPSCNAFFKYAYQNSLDSALTDPNATDSMTIYFFDASAGNPNRWTWDFGDGNTDTVENPVHTYQLKGEYLVNLEISTSSCTSSYSNIIYLGVPSNDCMANFWYVINNGSDSTYTDSSITTVSNELTVNFYDASSGNPNIWYWKFGDDTYSFEQNPTHIFTSSGVYIVSLLVIGENCNNITSQLITIEEPAPDCKAVFGYDYLNWNDSSWFEDSTNTEELTFYFYDYSYGDPTQWAWNFGDGGTSTDQNPTHTYSSAGEYWVSLDIKSETCESSYGMPVWAGGYTNDTTWQPDGCMSMFIPEMLGNFTVQFTNLSYGGFGNCIWDFGDGITNMEMNPVHIYPQAGNYLVTLTISSADTCSSSFSMEIFVTNEPDSTELKALFCPELSGNMVRFHDLSEGNILNWYWDFGDGMSVREPNPVHYYQELGTYIVTLGIGNALQVSTYTMQIDLKTGDYKGFFNGTGINSTPMLNTNLAAYPVPMDNELTIRFNSDKSTSGIIQIVDISGKVIYEKMVTLNTGENKMQVSTLRWMSGVYFLNLIIPQEPVNRIKLIK